MFRKILRSLLKKPATSLEDKDIKTVALAVDREDRIQMQRRRKKNFGWGSERKEPSLPEFKLRKVSDFPIYDGLAGGMGSGSLEGRAIMDSAEKLVKSGDMIALDDSDGSDSTLMLKGGINHDIIPFNLQMWYMSQGFIGYQGMAIMAQNWLVNKACTMAGEDAARNGWVLKLRDSSEITTADRAQLLAEDKRVKIKENLIELNRFKNVFGIRVAIFKVKSNDPLYYEKPFNIDGVTKDSYEGISQVDPYWMMPVMNSQSTNDPSSIRFYEPEFWTISDVKYHHSHLIIVRGPQPADVLKPTYIFGGVSVTQQIYERVYNAERTANESPLLAMSKRITALHADLDKVAADEDGFMERITNWVSMRDNHGIKVLGKEETMEQFDTSLADMDAVIMNQYQLVAAIARVPATKLLGTSPKGFNATGEFETISYHEELESIQEHVMMPVLERHYEIACRSLGLELQIEPVCNPVDSVTTQGRADLNAKKAETGASLIASGVISPDEERTRILEDEHSGYTSLSDETANETPGMSPENIAAFEKAGADNTKANAETTEAVAGAETSKPGEPGSESRPGNEVAPGAPKDAASAYEGLSPELQAVMPFIVGELAKNTGNTAVHNGLLAMLSLAMAGKLSGPDEDIGKFGDNPPVRGTLPGVTGRTASVKGVHSVVGSVMDWNPTPMSLPKTKMHGMPITIENPRGSIRKGMSMNGDTWQVKMPHHYGFFRGVIGTDGDELDCFIGPNKDAKNVYVISQVGLDNEFDEYKVMLGFDSEQEAIQGYNDSFSPGWDGLGDISEMGVDDFIEWVRDGNGAKAPV